MDKMPDKVRSLMRSRRVSQSQLAEASGMTQSGVSKILNGGGRPYADQLWNWSRLLGVPVDYLLDDTQDEPPAGLSEDDRTVLKMARLLGTDRALLRLMVEPVIGPLPPPPPSPGPRS